MSIMNQCTKCRLEFNCCGHYDHTDQLPCPHFVKPVDNSKKFAKWYSFKGRIGRLEYALTVLIAIALYFALAISSVIFLALFGIYTDLMAPIEIVLLSLFISIPSAYLLLAAGIKRINDTRSPKWIAYVPVVFLVLLSLGILPGILPMGIVVLACIYLFNEPGEEGVNEHGSNPAQPYDEQIRID